MKSFLLFIGALASLFWGGYAILSSHDASLVEMKSVMESMPAPTKATLPSPVIPVITDDANVSEVRRAIALLHTELATLKQQLATLKDTVAKLPTQADLAQLESKIAQTLTMAGESNPENLETEEMILAQQQDENHLFTDTVEGMFQAESTDLDWSDHTITAIEEALTKEPIMGTSVLDVECRSTLCRIETQHDDPLAQAEFQSRLSEGTAELNVRMTSDHTDLGDGLSHTVIYLVREGYQFPNVEPPQ